MWNLANRALGIEVGVLAFALVVGLICRMIYLDATPFWVDEAESSINALTILEHGYPTDSYLGLPIFENTLVQRWPESAEYEFRDVSYSRKHLAVYHGWLPLYAMAGVFALSDVSPDKARSIPMVQHDSNERKRRTRLARLPAVMFGILFLVTAYTGGWLLYGRDAGWTALLIGALHPYHVAISRQGRYYSAQVLLTTTCAICFWMLAKHCRWKHVYLAALVFTLLFYTHLLSFFAAGSVWLLFLPWILKRHEDAVRKMLVFVLLVSAATLPWVFLTGFYGYQAQIPRAWPMLRLPADLWRYPMMRPGSALLGLFFAGFFIWILTAKSRLPDNFVAPVRNLGPALLFLSAWVFCGYVTFAAFIPAVSFDASRLNLSYWGPAFLLASISCAAVSRMVTARYSAILSPAILLLLLWITGHTFDLKTSSGEQNWKADAVLFDYLAALKMDANTKIYAAPNDHLILSFYTGLPVQDMTPVRKSYLDSYRGDVVYVDRPFSIKTSVLTAATIRQAAEKEGRSLSPEAVECWSSVLCSYDYRAAMLKALARNGRAEIPPVPPFAEELLARNRNSVEHSLSNSSLELVTRGFSLKSWTDWRAVLKYRFVGPNARNGTGANYVARLRTASATILTDANAVVYESHWRPPDAPGQLTFRFVPPLPDLEEIRSGLGHRVYRGGL